VCLIARYFEAKGLPTLILGSALDILSAGRPPRAKFLNYPLGFEAGRPFDDANQLEVLSQALTGFDDMQHSAIETLDLTWEAGWDLVSNRTGDSTGTDLRSPSDMTPRYQSEQDRHLAERNASR